MVAGVITVSGPSCPSPFTGLSPRRFGKLVTAMQREGADPVRKGRAWSLPLEDRILLLAAYRRTNSTAPWYPRGMAASAGVGAAARITWGRGESSRVRAFRCRGKRRGGRIVRGQV